MADKRLGNIANIYILLTAKTTWNCGEPYPWVTAHWMKKWYPMTTNAVFPEYYNIGIKILLGKL